MSEQEPTHERKKCTKEVERKFLINLENLPEDLACKEILELQQSYVAIAEDGSETRVRKTTESGEASYQLTVKSKANLVRDDAPIIISEQMFEELINVSGGKPVAKTRLTIPYDGEMIELDIYAGSLDGLVVAEVKFSRESVKDAVDAAHSFELPVWFGDEVTDDKRYNNQSLATSGLPTA